MRWQTVLFLVILAAVLIFAVFLAPHLAGWAYIHFGIKGFGPWYGFWSGAGSDMSYLTAPVTLCIALAAWYRRNNCEVHTCWRLGRHDTLAGHTVCRRHHPDDKLTHQDVLDAHENILRAGNNSLTFTVTPAMDTKELLYFMTRAAEDHYLQRFGWDGADCSKEAFYTPRSVGAFGRTLTDCYTQTVMFNNVRYFVTVERDINQ